MFDMSENVAKKEELYQMRQMKELPKKEVLLMEKEMLGLYVSGHPLDNYIQYIDKYSTIKSTDLMLEEFDEVNNKSIEEMDGKEVKIFGIISSVRTKITKNNEKMAFVSLEDLEGTFDLIVFPKTYAQYRSEVYEDNIVQITGRISVKEDEITVIALKITTFENHNYELMMALSDKNKMIQIKIPQDKTEYELQELRNLIKEISNQKGNIDVEMRNKGVPKILPMYIDEKIYENLKNKVGEENLKIIDKEV